MPRIGSYDVIVIGGGHAGCEAALATGRMGLRTCLFTMNVDTIAQLSCNPAIGGLAKGHLVREIDALGGQMAKITDAAGIQFRVLNRSKGPAVWSMRSQADRSLYKFHMKDALDRVANLSIKQAAIEELLVEDNKISGVVTASGETYEARAVVVTTGTFLNGLIHIGLTNYPSGRAGEFPSVGLSDSLRRLGFKMGRLKTGTPPRIDAKTIDFSKTTTQWGDDPPEPFSFSTREITNPQLPCFITYTNETTHTLIRASLERSPLYSGVIKGVGARYCPSIEDKVVRFAEKPRHQVFLEPEGLHIKEYYANGIPTSLPVDVQLHVVRSIEGLADAEIVRPGYAIEYDCVYPTQLRHTLETKSIGGLYLAGQINGTSGYEEAAAQGIIAGINAALKIKDMPPLILQRHEAYIGVLIDDLVTLGTKEPYRMFTSRAEYRLLLRNDNAEMRLREIGQRTGLVTEEDYSRFTVKRDLIAEEISRLKTLRASPGEINDALIAIGTTAVGEKPTLEQLLRRPEVTYEIIEKIYPSPAALSLDAKQYVETEIKYEGYVRQQQRLVERMKKLEFKQIPPDFDYRTVSGLSREVLGKLEEVRPETVGQAGRIPGVTPAAVALLMVVIEKLKRKHPI
ncbi:tRNA uridine-5-carboxymethylaminomethyl(34) synthesis enzyme MnmG [Candidatus Magnetominusculus xianensis]|uniref:tRNA uridine 5-carboxymethylaminomethyl modification enzyme MnmG n=1 Tax=Candidatus Magnetominusculus xianensis TaxID=1748249 RepID=A0ABR5SB55_9BACT|nr:tRNA uridine-5-carboxymethylaminomethyl(34) synthesis enzyme MnmG [Candidatus Magnetominusculus xianensis]KWT76396.1 tRNA uridine 5-carboxymethylaminomethyl modification protein GidA [Candidatus Magnetominusculus xianensis]MBF0404864.1 tRNA uridine-5-carboxymethylaminomethyl(34) synthesis enzyme MnmG [Nitrospirota bacterium]